MHKSPQPDGVATLAARLQSLPGISLDDTNRLARMLKRVDNKYVVTFAQFQTLVESIDDQYAALEIDGLRQFAYASCYYDDEHRCYLEHHQKRRQRFKVRTREYLDSGQKYFEVKLKGPRGLTLKHRVDCDYLLTPSVNGENLQMLKEVYEERYRKPMPLDLRPSLMVYYKRCTLVALQGGERVTIDHNMRFNLPEPSAGDVEINNDFIIIETKSGNGKGATDRALKKMGIPRARGCSKYCVGVNLTGKTIKNNNFLNVIKRVRRNIVGSDSRPFINDHRVQVGVLQSPGGPA